MESLYHLVICYCCLCCTCCFKLNVSNGSRLSSVFNLDDIADDIRQNDKQKYLNSYIRNLFEEISIYDNDRSLVVNDETNVSEVEKLLAKVHVLHVWDVKTREVTFDISNLTRHLTVTHVELVASFNNDDHTENLVFDVTETFTRSYDSGTEKFQWQINNQSFLPLKYDSQLLVFENINKTRLDSLRLRHKRWVRNEENSFELQGNKTRLPCSVKPWKVDFFELEWHWLLAPTSYYANTCSGRCNHFAHLGQFSNHAFIKDSYRLINDRGDLQVTCSPFEYAPQSILYIDKHSVLNLKQLPNMKVISCNCR